MAGSEKRSDFLWLVQMIMINYREKVTGWSGVAGDAVAASYRVPESVTARDAALHFCACFVEGFNGDNPAECLGWMTELKDPT